MEKFILRKFKSYYKNNNLNLNGYFLLLYLLIESFILNNFKIKEQKYSHKLNGIDPYTAVLIIGFITGWMIAKKYLNKD